ncbi:polyphosphate kinase [Candidatus Methanoplasma termitum]|uniref:Polyphosphate kinase n=1 Tax=Candidatus Methanoplasma termitum TaxID=1577791 RepID=A0A0A7LAG4_9ARCH|nr:polyphosphate kinase 1 [Candidatus Methanoplasma termitum]AIZ56110.1 polyphosphate kinase [Candidatus Methanoplasma termitum]MCL2334365.1 polyphosphate kinase 1 [Candidatus Methanoplasma sp.]
MKENINLFDHSLYVNRELSWLEFNRRCLAEAGDGSVPLLERVKFLAIAYGNMDEFFMIRVPGLLQRAESNNMTNIGPDIYLDAKALMHEIKASVDNLVIGYEICWGMLRGELFKNGIRIHDVDSLSESQRAWVADYYKERVHPLLTPLALDVSHPFPFISNNSLNVAVKIDHNGQDKYARVKVPIGILPRFVRVPSETAGMDFVQLEDIIESHIEALFPGMISEAYLFRVTRNADIKVTIDEAYDLMSAIETSLDSRDIGFPVRMLAEEGMPPEMLSLFGTNLKLGENQIHTATLGGMLLTDLWQIASIDAPQLKDESFVPYVPPEFGEGHNIFKTIKEKDWIIFHPYEPFDIIVRFLRDAADDPNVQSIKICLYRIGKDRSIINALKRAKEKGKAVTVLMELRAKFDETNNIYLAKELDKMGVHVVYGPIELKVHSKLLQVVRLEKDKLVKYTHISSGNYNMSTARQYGDISFLTANEEIGKDVGELFNALTGVFGPREYRHLLVAPAALKKALIEKIGRERENQKQGKKAYIAIKANGLVDSDIIAELYKASMAGVKIDLNIRGICCLRPGVKGISENIRVISIVDRFLEHSRIYYFENDGDPEIYLGSSDVMPRNLIARVEVLFPVLDKNILYHIKNNILDVHLKDTAKAKMLTPEGNYIPINKKGRKFRSQKWFIDHRGIWHG